MTEDQNEYSPDGLVSVPPRSVTSTTTESAQAGGEREATALLRDLSSQANRMEDAGFAYTAGLLRRAADALSAPPSTGHGTAGAVACYIHRDQLSRLQQRPVDDSDACVRYANGFPSWVPESIRSEYIPLALAAPAAAIDAGEQEVDALIFKLECFIDHATGGKLSKSSWALETLKAAHDEYLNSFVDEALAERLASRSEAPAAGEAVSAPVAVQPDLRASLVAAANYIDALGGDSKSYRAALATPVAAVAQPVALAKLMRQLLNTCDIDDGTTGLVEEIRAALAASPSCEQSAGVRPRRITEAEAGRVLIRAMDDLGLNKGLRAEIVAAYTRHLAAIQPTEEKGRG